MSLICTTDFTRINRYLDLRESVPARRASVSVIEDFIPRQICQFQGYVRTKSTKTTITLKSASTNIAVTETIEHSTLTSELSASLRAIAFHNRSTANPLIATWESLWEDAEHEDTNITVSKHSAQLRSSISCIDVTSQTRKKLSRIATWDPTDLTRSSTSCNSPCKTRSTDTSRALFIFWNISETRIPEASCTKKKIRTIELTHGITETRFDP